MNIRLQIKWNLLQAESSEWPQNHPYTKRLKELHRLPNPAYETYKKGIEHSDPSISANVIIGLIRVTCYLLERQIQYLEKGLVCLGPFKATNQLLRARGQSSV